MATTTHDKGPDDTDAHEDEQTGGDEAAVATHRSDARGQPEEHNSESPRLTSRALNLATLIILGVLVIGGISVEQYVLRTQDDPNQRARPDLQETHLINLRPETEDVLPEEFLDSIAYCMESDFAHYSDSPFPGTPGYSCSPWRTEEEDLNEVMTFHYSRDIVVGDDATAVREKIPHISPEPTEVLRSASDDAPEVVFHGVQLDDWGSGYGDIFIYYPEDSIIIGWPWRLDDEGVDGRSPLEIAEAEGF